MQFKEIKVGEFFKTDITDSVRVKTSTSGNGRNNLVVNGEGSGSYGFCSRKTKVTLMEPCEFGFREKRLTLKNIGIMQRFQFLSDKGKNIFFWKIKPQNGFNLVSNVGTLHKMEEIFEVELV